MPFTNLLLLTLLSQAPTQSAPAVTVQAGGHMYQLFCSPEGEEIRASETGLCEKTESGGVQRLEVRNEDGEVQFSQDAPAGNPFTYVGIFSFAKMGREIFYVDTSHDEGHGSGLKPGDLIYYFDPTASGLVPFNPPLVGVDGFAQVSAGAGLSKTFNAGFFQFSVLLVFNAITHRIAIMPDQLVYSALAPPGLRKSGPSAASGAIKLYSNHANDPPKAEVRIVPGHTVTWWESLDPAGKTPAKQVVTILAAWAPASLKPADNAPDGVRMVYYDWNNLWLQIQVDDQTGWIKGISSFRTIGLEMTNAKR
jgi:hypothetical protein